MHAKILNLVNFIEERKVPKEIKSQYLNAFALHTLENALSLGSDDNRHFWSVCVIIIVVGEVNNDRNRKSVPFF
jgi:hypothetical protein